MRIELNRRVLLYLLAWFVLAVATIAKMAWSEGDSRGWLRGYMQGSHDVERLYWTDKE